MKTTELTEATLDWAVAKCENVKVDIVNGEIEQDYFLTLEPDEYGFIIDYSPSAVWHQGGPIIEREKISLESPRGTYWTACMWTEEFNQLTGHHHYGAGDTPLIAAMRCYVASKSGGEVEIPEELML